MPSRARNRIVNKDQVGQYHCISRVVRRAFLCGEDRYTGKNYDHRKKWIEEMLQYMVQHFALDLISLSIMDNHLHLQLRIRPDIVTKWSNREVARRWLLLYPQRRDRLPRLGQCGTPHDVGPISSIVGLDRTTTA